MNLKELFQRKSEEFAAQREQLPCPPPSRWWRVELGEDSWTESETSHVASCPHCQRTMAKFQTRNKSASYGWRLIKEYGLSAALGAVSLFSLVQHFQAESTTKQLLDLRRTHEAVSKEFAEVTADVQERKVELRRATAEQQQLATQLQSVQQQAAQQRDELQQLSKDRDRMRSDVEAVTRDRDARRAALEQLQAEVTKRATDGVKRELDRGREFTFRDSGSPEELVIQLSPFLGPPYYVSLDVVWEEGLEEPETLYHNGYVPLQPLVRHRYELPRPGGRKQITMTLKYYLTGEAMERFLLPQVVEERLHLVLTSVGIRAAVDSETDAISAAITSPSEDYAVVDSEFSLELDLQAPREAARRDQVIHVLIRQLDGPEVERQGYFVQPFTLRSSQLLDSAIGVSPKFETWVSLPGVDDGNDNNASPTQFEILIVELPIRSVEAVIPKARMNLEDPELVKSVVRARRIVKYIKPVDD